MKVGKKKGDSFFCSCSFFLSVYPALINASDPSQKGKTDTEQRSNTESLRLVGYHGLFLAFGFYDF